MFLCTGKIWNYLAIVYSNIMNKKTFFVPVSFVAMVLMLSSCAAVQYTSRQVNVNRSNIATEQQVTQLEVDWNHQITATSGYQPTRQEAAKEAEFLCLQEGNIDVVVDPVFKFQYEPLRTSLKWKATVVGYAGKYRDTLTTGVEAAQKYEMEDIEKYKMLTDPNFPQYYYRKFDSSCHSDILTTSTSSLTGRSVILQQTAKKRHDKEVKTYDFFKAKELRDAGIATTIVGAALTFIVGIPCFYAPNKEIKYTEWKTYEVRVWTGEDKAGNPTYEWKEIPINQTRYETNHEAHRAGIAMMAIGSASMASGIPMWCVGSYRMKHSADNIEISLGANVQGMGIKLSF